MQKNLKGDEALTASDPQMSIIKLASSTDNHVFICCFETKQPSTVKGHSPESKTSPLTCNLPCGDTSTFIGRQTVPVHETLSPTENKTSHVGNHTQPRTIQQWNSNGISNNTHQLGEPSLNHSIVKTRRCDQVTTQLHTVKESVFKPVSKYDSFKTDSVLMGDRYLNTGSWDPLCHHIEYHEKSMALPRDLRCLKESELLPMAYDDFKNCLKTEDLRCTPPIMMTSDDDGVVPSSSPLLPGNCSDSSTDGSQEYSWECFSARNKNVVSIETS